MKIAVLIPTYKRPHKLEPLLKNFLVNSTEANKIYFIIDPEDRETLVELNRLYSLYKDVFSIFTVAGEYVEAINTGASLTKEPFIFCGADDILFTPFWDKKLLKVMEDELINVTGGIDDWLCTKSGVHISHPLVRRSYIEGIGSFWGGRGKLYFEGYKHYQCDIELEQLAWTRNCFRLCKEVTIHHNHFINKKSENDNTYSRSKENLRFDTELYEKRAKNFEYWSVQALHQGFAKESQFMRKRLSIVMPIWNCKDYVIKTLESLIEQTRHKYELIMLDDASTEFDGNELLAELKQRALAGGFTNVIVEASKVQRYCNFNWNRGVELATGNYIAVINSDIEFKTPEWDDYLIENIDLGYELVNPFESNHVYGDHYQLPPPQDLNSRMKIRGACYMMSRKFAKRVFPIPSEYTHWFGDDHIGYNAKTWLFDIRVDIKHYISKSGAKVDKLKFWKMVRNDAFNWLKNHPDQEYKKIIIENCDKQIKSAQGGK